MSKKQFDNIEDKIREAADNNQPDFNEAAWGKMTLLLDKEGRRRRPLLWLIPLLLALATGGGYLLYNNTPDEENTTVSVQDIKENKTKNKNITKRNALPNEIEAQLTEPAANKTAVQRQAGNSTKKDEVTTDNANQYTKTNYKKEIKKLKVNISKNQASDNAKEKVFARAGKTDDGVLIKNGTQKTLDKIAVESIDNKKAFPTTDTKDQVKAPAPANNLQADDDKAAKKLTVAINETPDKKIAVAAAGVKNKNISEKKKNSRFYLLALIGADAASVKFLSFNNSRLAASYGIGAGFQITKKLSLQSGFYVVQKKYIAGPGDYNAKAGSYWSQAQINKVDAVCMVYEIPLALRYTFLQKPSVVYFATAGISSYIMKKEDYFYNYIYYGIPKSGRYIYTGNKNFFSMLTLSAGIDKQLSNHLSFIVSPSVSIPLAGVGDGSIKLFSAGIQAGIKFQPGRKK